MSPAYKRSPDNIAVSRQLARRLTAVDEALDALAKARARAVRSIVEDRKKRVAAERDRDDLRSAARNARREGSADGRR